MTILFERDQELDMVRSALVEARKGLGSVVLMTGPLGIGRSALLAEAANHADAAGLWVLRAQGAVLEQDLGLGVAHQLLDPVVESATWEQRRRWRTSGAEGARCALGDDSLLSDSVLPPGPRGALVLGLCALISDIAVDQPVALIVDDIQWADSLSLSWLSALARRVRGEPVVLLLSALDGDIGGDRPLVRELRSCATRTIRPRPLSLTAVDRMARDAAGPCAAARSVDDLVRRIQLDTGGNPLLLCALLAELRDTEPPLGPALREKFAATLARQRAPVRAYAHTVAVVGDDIEPRLVGRLAGLDLVGTEHARGTLHQLGLLPHHTAPHLLRRYLPDLADDAMPMADHKRLRHRAAAALNAYGYPPERVAACLLPVAGPAEDWSTEILRAAADSATLRGDTVSAARYLRRALLDLPASSRERATLLTELAAVEHILDPASAMRHMSQAVAQLPAARDRTAALVRLPPTVLGRTSPYLDQQTTELAEMLGRAGELTGPESELALRLEAITRFAGHEDRAELAAAIRRLRSMGSAPPLDTLAERELLSVLLFMATLGNGLPAVEVSAMASKIVALTPVAAAQLHTTVPLLLTCVAAAGVTPDVLTWLETTIELAERQRTPVTQILVLSARVVLAARTGQLARATQLAGTVCDLLPTRTTKVIQMPAVAVLSVAISANDPALSRRVLRACRQCQAEPAGLLTTALVQALDGLTQAVHDPLTALHRIEDCGRRLDGAGWRNPALQPWRSWAALVHRRLGDRERALRLLDEEHELATSWGAPAPIARTLRLRADLLDDPQRITLLRRAEDVLLEAEDELESARTQISLGSALLAMGDHAAEEHLRRGLMLGERCGASRTVERARQLLTTCGVRTPPSVTDLTEAERRIAALAAEGRTNQDIADEFGISKRAVEKHLTSCYRKLGIVGRADLVDALRR